MAAFARRIVHFRDGRIERDEQVSPAPRPASEVPA